MKNFFLCLLNFFFFTTFIFADVDNRDQEISELKQEIQQLKVQINQMHDNYDEVINKMQERIDQLEQQKIASSMQPYEEKLNDLQAKVNELEQNKGGLLKGKWIPEIGVVADAVYKQDSAKTDTEGSDRLSLRELELVLGSAVDPYSRLDATISFSDTEAPSLEEAYLTRFGLPLDTTARLGKFKPKVGKALPMHRDSLDTVDEPRVIEKYFGKEGMNKSGLDFTKMIDFPWPITHQLTFGVLEGGNGEEGTAFGTTRRRPTLYSHLKNYLDITDLTGLELGFSHLIGSRDADSRLEVQILGSDITLTHHFNTNQNVKVQGEVFNLNRKETTDFDGNLWGSYGLVDFRFHPRWSIGFRYDNVQLVNNPADNPQKEDVGYTGYLTFYETEFARWRLQGTHTNLTTGKDDNTIYFQGTFAIGEHKHKLQ